jgi:hypothetical protein
LTLPSCAFPAGPYSLYFCSAFFNRLEVDVVVVLFSLPLSDSGKPQKSPCGFRLPSTWANNLQMPLKTAAEGCSRSQNVYKPLIYAGTPPPKGNGAAIKGKEKKVVSNVYLAGSTKPRSSCS